MFKISAAFGAIFGLALGQTAFAVTLAELKAIDPLEEERGWCVDLFAHLTGGLPIGGFQGHNCFLYMGNGPTEDQGFDSEALLEDGIIRLAYFDVCMTLHEQNPGSFVAAEPCTGAAAQSFEFRQNGEIAPASAPELCLTLGPDSVPGGGGTPVHLIRKLSFELCEPEAASRQQWELRYSYQPSEPTLPRPYN